MNWLKLVENDKQQYNNAEKFLSKKRNRFCLGQTTSMKIFTLFKADDVKARELLDQKKAKCEAWVKKVTL
jgi:hypothetical protein